MSQTDGNDTLEPTNGDGERTRQSSPDPKGSEPASKPKSPDTRARIALEVLKWSGIVLAGLAILAVGSAGLSDLSSGKVEALPNIVDKLISSYLPLLGTWVGTVLAYYFARENFEAASEQTNKLLNQTLSERLDSIRVIDVMTRFENIIGILDKTADKDKSLEGPDSLRSQIRAGATRLVVKDKRKVIAVIHASTLSDFILKAPDEAARSALTLGVLLADKDVKQVIERIAFVSDTATMDDVKIAMERVSGTADVFVTPGASPEEQPIGWVTNNDLAKHSQYVRAR